MRAKEVIQKMNRRKKYIENEKHVMLKSIRKCFQKASQRKKTKKQRRTNTTVELNDPEEEEEDNEDLILSQNDSNAMNLDGVVRNVVI